MSHQFSTMIPDAVQDLGLDPYSFRLYTHIERVCQETGLTCNESVRESSEACNMSPTQVFRARHVLIQKKLIQRVEAKLPEQARAILIAKQAQLFTDDHSAIRTCEWCYGTTLVLHAHHYPIPESEGGKNTVNICPNCHAEYHALTTGSYALSSNNGAL